MNYRVFLCLLLLGCSSNKPPKEKLSQYRLGYAYTYREGYLQLRLTNTLQCPVRFWVQSEDPALKPYFAQWRPILLGPLRDTILEIETPAEADTMPVYFASRLGDPSKEVRPGRMGLPFQKNRSYRLIQGYDSGPTHNTEWSRYALDFGLPVGDTVCAAADGYVVGMVRDYRSGGVGEQWKNYGNYITLYHPETGLYSQYVHLKYRGSLVRVGDRVRAGQPIGLAGMTGQTNVEHLHFNCLKPSQTEEGLVSIPLDSIGGYKVSDLKRYGFVRN